MTANRNGTTLLFLVSAILHMKCIVAYEVTPWLPTYVALVFFDTPKPQLLYSTSCRTVFQASMKCDISADCNIFCEEKDGTYSFWLIRAEPFLSNNGPRSFKKCWTRNPRKNLILEPGTVLSSPPLWRYPDRTVEKLSDGIYYDDLLFDAFHLAGLELLYLLVDFGQEFVIKKINVYPGLYEDDPRLYNIYIASGNSLVNDDFSHFSEVDFIETPPTIKGIPFSVDLSNPITARYLAVYKPSGVLRFNHIQVYTYLPHSSLST